MNKGKVAIGFGIIGAIGGILYLATKAKAKPPPPPPGLANLYGKVKDKVTGESLANVLVSLNGYTTYTDSSGYYEFTNIQPGSYMVEFTKEGYEKEIR